MRAPADLRVCRMQGVTLIELLVVVVVIAVVLSIAFPVLVSSRLAGREVATVSNLKQIGASLHDYAAENRDDAPSVFRAATSNHPTDPPQRVSLNGQTAYGHWFDNSHFFHMAISPGVPSQVLEVPGTPQHAKLSPPLACYCQFALSECFYADSEFWHSVRSQRPELLRVQRWSDIAFPSAKGALQQLRIWGHPKANQYTFLPASIGVKSGVLWADQSAGLFAQGLLRSGIPNRFDHYYFAQGGEPHPTTIARTRDGLRGFDR